MESLIKFNVPDLQGAFLRGFGVSDNHQHNVGALIGTPQSDNVGPHIHPEIWGTPGGSGVLPFTSANQNTNIATKYNTGENTQPTSYGGETRPYNYSVYYYIKT